MTFWGIELKPGKPYIHRYDSERGRLHISQATLGTDSSTKKSIVQCDVGDKKPIYLCSLLPERLETSALNLEFKEEDEVTFSVIGPHNVHLSGFFYYEDEEDDCGWYPYIDIGNWLMLCAFHGLSCILCSFAYLCDVCVTLSKYGSMPICDLYVPFILFSLTMILSNHFEEDIMGIDSEDEDDSLDYDSEDEDGDDDFTDNDLTMNSSSPVPNGGAKIEEIVDDENPKENGVPKRARKKKSQSCKNDDHENSDRQIIIKTGTGAPVLEEDEYGFPISKAEFLNSKSKTEETKDDQEGEGAHKKKTKVDASKNLKRKIDAVGEDEEHAREKESKKKKKKKQNKKLESPAKANAEQKMKDKNGAHVQKEEKAEVKPLQVKSFPNGLVIEELSTRKPNGKIASSGKKVSVRYIGKLKKNGKIFDSNIGRAPFQFRLGAGQVIKGWDVGVNGMHVGEKRRLTIPPAMGYGAKGAGGAIPPNSWLVFDVELVGVK